MKSWLTFGTTKGRTYIVQIEEKKEGGGTLRLGKRRNKAQCALDRRHKCYVLHERRCKELLGDPRVMN